MNPINRSFSLKVQDRVQLGTLLKQFTDYVKRVLADSGLIRDQSVTRQFIQMCKSNGMLDSILFAWFGEAGYKQRTSGINTFWTKLYSLVGTNDATQTTSTSQPYISGNIAPTERIGMKNPNGGSNYMTHPTISFAANEAWSVTTVVNWNGDISTNELYGKFGSSELRIKSSSLNILLFLSSMSVASTGSKSTASLIGKSSILTLVANGDGSLFMYLNGLLFESFSTLSNRTVSEFNSIISGRNSLYTKGSIFTHIIRAEALTPTQVAAEANFLRSLYPEIPSVTIGSQVWATSNCDMVATPMGNLIQNVTANTNVEKITNGSFTGGTTSWNLGTGWSYGTNNVIATSATGTLNQIFSGEIGKWYRVQITLSSVTSGKLNYQVGGSGTDILIGEADGTFVSYYKPTTIGGIYFFPKNGFTGTIDNVSVQEVGWSDATNLYDYVYANTSGTVEQKTYAAVKAAAMWCYYNNDAAVGAIYGKLLNDYAIKLLDMDIAYYNTANPTTPWGWGISTEADWNILETTINNDAEALKHAGTTYWSAPNAGTNSSGFTALPAGYRKEDGTFGGLGTTALFGSTDMSVPRIGKSLRLIKR